MTRVLLYPGFHKTGTTSAQDFLHRNRPVLNPYARIVLHPPLSEIARWVWRYYQRPDPRILQVITEDLREVLSRLKIGGRALIISHENTLGPMPQGHGREAYDHAVPLLQAVLAAFDVLPGPVSTQIHLSTRDQSDWADSLYSHLVRKATRVRLTDSREEYVARMMARDQDRQVSLIRAGLAGIPVTTSRMAEQGAARFGLGQPFVDFLQLPPQVLDQLLPPRHMLSAPDSDVLDEMLALNRSDLDELALAEAKRAVMSRVRLQEPNR